jgi:regulatory protein
MDHEPPLPAPRVRSVAPLSGERARVELDDDTTLEVPLRALLQEGLAVGDPVDEALRALLSAADLRWRAREAALRLLTVRARSRQELGRRLRRKDFPAPVVDACLDELETQRLLDDDAFARAVVRDRVRLSPRGPGRLLQELRKRGVDDHVADAALAEVFTEEDVSVHELAREAALGWLRRQSASVAAALALDGLSDERERARRRLHGYLARRGFNGSAAMEGLDVVGEQAKEIAKHA